jgi:hypothetical protein
MNDSYVQSYVAFEGLPTPRFWSWMPRKIRRSYCDDSSAQALVQPPLTSSVDPSAGLHRPSVGACQNSPLYGRFVRFAPAGGSV